MIIDSHAHVVMPLEMYRFMADLASSRGNPVPRFTPPEEPVRAAVDGLIRKMDEVGTDIQLLSPRPFAQMHSVRPSRVSRLWAQAVNDAIHMMTQMHPGRIYGVAGLPQFRDESPVNSIEELERCVKELGFVGCLINPDPVEGDGSPPPGMGDEFWYPLYEKMVELDIPGMVHSASSSHPRESYTLKFINEESIAIISILESSVFDEFPNLKIIVPHSGGAIPFHMGRFRAWNLRRKEPETFEHKMRKLYFDTCNYSKDSLEFLIKTVGVDNVMFGTERPGTGSVHCPETGRDFDDLKPVIESIEWLSVEDRAKIFEGTCRKVYTTNFNPGV